jgi:hypothetical protein
MAMEPVKTYHPSLACAVEGPVNKTGDRALSVLVVVTILLVVLLGTMIGYRFFAGESTVEGAPQAVHYIHDKRTNLCFAVWRNRALTTVPCKRVEKELHRGQAR